MIGGKLFFPAVLAVMAVSVGCAPKVEGRTAFIGAEGYGAGAEGGHGGRIMKVTSLADRGAGTLRECIEAVGRRVCVFEVSGVIRFTRQRPVIRNPYITIAGETAPGDGITLAHAGGRGAYTPLTIKDTHNVIVRHIRVRADLIGESRGGNDAINISNSEDVILDHVSASWALDENLGAWGDNDRLTISWSVFAEGIPPHDKCALLASDPDGPQQISFVRNLCAHNGDRNPDVNVPRGSCVDVVNNVFYNAESQFTEIWESYGGSPVNVVGNFYRAGPDTDHELAAALDRPTEGSKGTAQIYAADNVMDGIPLQTDRVSPALVDNPPCPLQSRPVAAEQAMRQVLDQAGTFPRDAVDERIVSEVRRSGGHIRRSPGDLPALAAGQPYRDGDGDGMADSWERENGANPEIADAWEGADGDGWTHLDRFLHFMHLQRMARQFPQ
ncbi:pectate lyase family protein [Aurantiacibacter poecillastricola]|uniref:pectate lyase family protein n=1 Tax=Aurantiacibacter poecillastricola TaxID=3064385 RepID=UPI00273FBD46|nr:pectate lyase [Aurantiacibacter sp. 219JJ12-13]MDP5259991.1 pectate lyase [Aurantiacibacter sp. 219JJ12-13]